MGTKHLGRLGREIHMIFFDEQMMVGLRLLPIQTYTREQPRSNLLGQM